MAEWIRPQTSIPEVPGSNPSLAVVPLGKVLYPHRLVFWRRLSAVGPMYRRVTHYARERTHFTSRKRAGRNPGEVVRQSNIWKRMNDVDPSWFTLEGYITQYLYIVANEQHHQPIKYAIQKKVEDRI